MARAGERRPDIALVDVRIKGRLDGIKTAQLLQERFGVPIVYLTAHADDATLERAMKTRSVRLSPQAGQAGRAAERDRDRAPPATRGASVRARPRRSTSAPRPSTRKVRAPRARAVRRELEQVLGSPDFDAPRRSREFLRFVVEETLAGRGDAITQTTIATRGLRPEGRLRRHRGPHRADPGGAPAPFAREVLPALRRAGPGPDRAAQGHLRPRLSQCVPRPRRRGGDRGGARARQRPERRARWTVPSDGWPSLVVSRVRGRGPDSEAQRARGCRSGEELALELGRYWAVRVSAAERAGRGRSLADRRARFALDGAPAPGGRGPAGQRTRSWTARPASRSGGTSTDTARRGRAVERVAGRRRPRHRRPRRRRGRGRRPTARGRAEEAPGRP